MVQRAPRKKIRLHQVEEDWEGFQRALENALRECDDNKDQAVEMTPYDDCEGTLQRLTYAFVRNQLQRGAASHLERCLYNLLHPRSSRSRSKKPLNSHHKEMGFDDNPFNYVLKALNAAGFSINPDVRSRYARQLIYAHRHDIDPHFLIGFLHQSGGQLKVAKKAKDPLIRENWFIRKGSAANVDDNFPLFVIDFDATDLSLKGYPIRLGRASVYEAGQVARGLSMLIKPDRSWKIHDDWYSERGAEIGVTRNELLNAETAEEIFWRLEKLTEGISDVYCYDPKLCGYWLDKLFQAAGMNLDFKLRDVSEYFGHNTEARIALRAKIMDEIGQARAGKRAAAVCNAMVEIKSSVGNEGAPC